MSFGNLLFYLVNSMVFTKNLWIILLHKILLALNLVEQTLKKKFKSHGFQFCAYPFVSFRGSWCIINGCVIFCQTKVAKHIWDQCCHLASKTAVDFFQLVPYYVFASVPICFPDCKTAKIANVNKVLEWKDSNINAFIGAEYFEKCINCWNKKLPFH